MQRLKQQPKNTVLSIWLQQSGSQAYRLTLLDAQKARGISSERLLSMIYMRLGRRRAKT